MGIILDLPRLTFSPKSSCDFAKIFCNSSSDISGSVRKTTTSSAYRLTLWVEVSILMPLMLGLSFIALAKGSIARANNKGYKEHPCLVPLCMEMVLPRILLVCIRAIG